jgi:hypothetical protein
LADDAEKTTVSEDYCIFATHRPQGFQCPQDGVSALGLRTQGSIGLFGQHGRVGITPVDPMVVAARAQKGLLLGAVG